MTSWTNRLAAAVALSLLQPIGPTASLAAAEMPLPTGAKPVINLRAETGKPGVFAVSLPGEYYRVSAYKERLGKGRKQDEDLLDLGRMVMMRAALLAIENGRDGFSIVGRIDTGTTGARTEILNAVPGVRGPDKCATGVDGNLICDPGDTSAGYPETRVFNPGYFGRKAVVRLWSHAEQKEIAAGRMERPSGPIINANAYYLEWRQSTSGRWPPLLTLYQQFEKRIERVIASGRASPYDLHMAAVNQLSLKRLYEGSGDTKKSEKAHQRAVELSALLKAA